MWCVTMALLAFRGTAQNLLAVCQEGYVNESFGCFPVLLA